MNTPKNCTACPGCPTTEAGEENRLAEIKRQQPLQTPTSILTHILTHLDAEGIDFLYATLRQRCPTGQQEAQQLAHAKGWVWEWQQEKATLQQALTAARTREAEALAKLREHEVDAFCGLQTVYYTSSELTQVSEAISHLHAGNRDAGNALRRMFNDFKARKALVETSPLDPAPPTPEEQKGGEAL
ncbi:hypothetical protein [Hymenobacter guriensis]|uniref:Uncharacterized protein n=1 Tax=Hymenobacter guriensis TaxID=2793065 RepID=A0ABS0KWU6_9BACT|nr:hypothetical protein [Hymenobacter guriensis]MBG8552340.1 hypothetical protein [Hymenobacter guriensis]